MALSTGGNIRFESLKEHIAEDRTRTYRENVDLYQTVTDKIAEASKRKVMTNFWRIPYATLVQQG
ncbi:hypothetical protein [Xenorhabdus bovienii]|uniref:hypothetical protein n=1 Tax=Xenorhabdus bovienii TaxID=40576 RepID=UPI00056E9265|nr:hypothetical protein [Xenorhabdus bovienii]